MEKRNNIIRWILIMILFINLIAIIIELHTVFEVIGPISGGSTTSPNPIIFVPLLLLNLYFIIYLFVKFKKIKSNAKEIKIVTFLIVIYFILLFTMPSYEKSTNYSSVFNGKFIERETTYYNVYGMKIY